MIFNKFTLENIKVGMTASYEQIITDENIRAFANLSGDINPVHLNDDYAKNSMFKKRIAHGFMTASYFSAIFGTKIPGEGFVYVSQTLNFKKPVFIGDTVVADVEVISVDYNKRRVRFSTSCKVNGSIVTDGEAELYVPMEFKKILITDKNELVKYRDKILELFEKCFDSSMDEQLWEWAYIKNPNGNPIVSLCFDEDNLVGHYAFIPVSLVYKQKSLSAVLSMTTMIDVNYRRHNLFKILAEDANEKAIELGYQLVYGFPNKQAAPGLKKRLGWVLEEDLYVANFSYAELQELDKKTYPNSISFNTQDRDNMDWRLSKPSQNYFRKHNSILKKFGDEVDIVFNGIDFSSFDREKKYNLLLDFDLDTNLDKRKFDYTFGYKIFDPLLEGVEFKKDLIMSDVF